MPSIDNNQASVSAPAATHSSATRSLRLLRSSVLPRLPLLGGSESLAAPSPTTTSSASQRQKPRCRTCGKFRKGHSRRRCGNPEAEMASSPLQAALAAVPNQPNGFHSNNITLVVCNTTTTPLLAAEVQPVGRLINNNSITTMASASSSSQFTPSASRASATSARSNANVTIMIDATRTAVTALSVPAFSGSGWPMAF
ncbi:hypothetical protein BKA70DRAFT_1430769 [Coprinopsis sp. MPI-PUGE-AT-0042]|nr:hypothetical protein BKA70DRAFT_1430769 [Coprinopsis sp. MPI-PUGE-AT-0042]